jgi:hypothetical protein
VTAAFGMDVDRIATEPRSLVEVARRRIDGRFPIDPFGSDPLIADTLAPFVTGVIRVEITGAERIPEIGPALLISNRGLGVVEPAAITIALRQSVGRRVRVVGAPDLPVVGSALHKLGSISYRPEDVAVALRLGHIVAAPLSPTWLRIGAGEPPRALLAATLGFPVLPVGVLPGGPLGLPIRAWRVRVGELIEPAPGVAPGDPLAAAELAERARHAVGVLLRGAG